jgi:hypothetical protein
MRNSSDPGVRYAICFEYVRIWTKQINLSNSRRAYLTNINAAQDRKTLKGVT